MDKNETDKTKGGENSGAYLRKKEITWRAFEMQVNTHHTYMDLLIRFNVFYYAITGALLSFYFRDNATTFDVLILVFPFVFSLVCGVFLIYSGHLATYLKKSIDKRARTLGLDEVCERAWPNAHVLVVTCRAFGSLMILVAIGIGALYFWDG